MDNRIDFFNSSMILGKMHTNDVIDSVTHEEYILHCIRNTPDSLYKFFPNTFNNESINHSKSVFSNKVFLSSPDMYNDPFDCQLKIDRVDIVKGCIRPLSEVLGFTILCNYENINDMIFDFRRQLYELISTFNGDIIENLESIIAKCDDEFKMLSCNLFVNYLMRELNNSECPTDNLFLEAFNKIIDKEIHKQDRVSKSFKVCCFCHNYNSILMWSHYANNHKGFCIEYGYPNLREIANIHFESLPVQIKDILQNLFPVIYTNRRYNFSEILGEDNFRNTDKNELWYLYKYGLLQKFSAWSYEEEWRLVYYNAFVNKDNLIKFFPIKSIIFGCKMPKEEKQEYVELAKIYSMENNCEIEIYEAEMDLYSYKLNFKKIY